MIYHRESDSWWAESDALPGFSALAPSFSEVRTRVQEYVEAEFGHVDLRLIEMLESGAKFVRDNFSFTVAGVVNAGLKGSHSAGSSPSSASSSSPLLASA